MTSRGYTLQRRIDYEVGGQSYVAALWTRRMRPPVWSEETDVAVASESDGETFGELDQNVARFMAEHQVPGLALAIARGGAIQYSRGFGWSVIGDESVEPETRFRIASVSKILTALAIYQLLEQGRLTLDDPMIEHLPNQCLPPVADRDERLARVTIRHLLNHSAGWDSERDPVFRIHDIARQSERQLPLDNREFIRLVLGQPLDYEPGEKGEYISFGYQILGRIIAHRGGLPYEEFVKRQILVPLGMNDTSLGRTRLMDRGEMEAVYYPMFEQSVSQETDGITSASGLAYGRGWTLENLDAAGGWVSTAPDLLRLVHGVARDRSPKLLSAESWTQFFSNPQMGYGSDWSSTYHANGWVVRPGESGNTCWATGFLTGSSCFVAYFGEEEDQFATALIANASDTPKGEQLVDFLDRLQYQLIRRYDGDFAITRASHVSDGPE